MKKRLIALFLCSALIFGMIPTITRAADDGKVKITSDGQVVSEVYVPMNDRDGVTVSAVLPDGVHQGSGQWEIYINSMGEWVNIHGATGVSLNLRFALLCNAMDEYGKAELRYTFTEVDSGEAMEPACVTAYVTNDSETATLEERDPQKITPIILDKGSVVIHELVEPQDKTDEKPEEKSAEEKSDEQTEEKSDEKSDEKPDEDKTNDQPSGENTDNNPAEEKSDEQTEERSDEKTDDQTTQNTPADDQTPGETPDAGQTPDEHTAQGETPDGESEAGVDSQNVELPDENSSEEAGKTEDTDKTEDTENVSLLSFLGLDSWALEVSAAEVGDSDVKKTYNIVVNYVFENNEIVSDPYTANLAEGSSFSVTVTFPTVQGYLPYVGETQQNSIELNYTNISKDETINVVYKPTNVNYTVIHYQQNVENDQYTEVARETKQGLTGSQVPDVAKEYDGFYNLLYERPAIAADGSTVIEVYYDRYYYLMNFDMDGGYGTEPVYARYGASIGKVNDPTKAGYSFGGWSETDGGTTAVTLPNTMPAANKTYYAIWTPDNTAKVTVVFWGENADDEGYSYLADQTKVINLKPGKEFTYSESEMLVCDKEVHTHTDDCLNCGKTEHTHSAVGGSCYTLTCTQESHTHSTGCYAGVGNQVDGFTLYFGNFPSNPSEGQVWSGTRSTYIYIKGNWYNYTGSTASGSAAPTTCGKTESTHTHTNACYTLTCTTEVHTHEQKCYTCGKEQHTHNSDCYMQGAGLDNKLWKFEKSDTVTVAADGSTVVNVYYERTTFTLHFRNTYSDTDNYGTITEKWGANIRTKFEAKNTAAGTALWSTQRDGDGPWTGFLDKMPQENRTYYAYKNGSTTHTATYYGEPLSGTALDTLYTSRVVYSGNLHVTKEDKVEIEGFTYVDTLRFNNRTYNSTANDSSFNGATFYYTRNTFKIEYNNYSGSPETKAAKYGASIDNNNFNWTPTDAQAPNIYEPGSVTFGGWYLNPQCTGEPYDFTNKTMPAGPNNKDGEVALVLYAKWVPVKHTVTFYLDKEAYDSSTRLETHPAITVPHGELAAPTPAAPEKGSYEFIGWFYMDNGVEKAFDFGNMQVRKDLEVYGKWSSNTLKEYTVQYVLKDDHSVKVADDLTGSGLAGTTKTFDAKGYTDLYAAYQEGYFPTVQSQSLLLDIDKETLTITFEYVPVEAVPYTVKYVEKDTGKSLADDKLVSDNRKAVVTETFKPISGYMPDAYQKRLVVTADGENILYFYYTKDDVHAMYIVKHFTQNTDGTNWTEYANSTAQGDIGTRYTASPMTIPGYTYKETKYVVNGTEVTDVTAEGAKLTENGLEINLYYVRNEYPYQVRYLEQGSGTQLADPKNGTGLYGQVISESAIDIDGYDKVDPTSVTLNIRIDEGEGAPKLNIITFYYKEQEVTINYVAVGPEGATGFGSVNPESETLKVKSGTAQGSTPTAGDGFKFVGWYVDAACTKPADATWVDATNKLTPKKNEDGKNVAATYYAKFEYDITSLTIQKQINGTQYDANEKFIFTVVGEGVNQRVVVPANGSITINGLKVGSTYTITEDNSWSWRYDTSSNLTNSSITLVATAESNVVAFTNTLKNNKWLTGDAYADNNFNK